MEHMCLTLVALTVGLTFVLQAHQRPASWQHVGAAYCSTVVPSDGEFWQIPFCVFLFLLSLVFPDFFKSIHKLIFKYELYLFWGRVCA